LPRRGTVAIFVGETNRTAERHSTGGLPELMWAVEFALNRRRVTTNDSCYDLRGRCGSFLSSALEDVVMRFAGIVRPLVASAAAVTLVCFRAEAQQIPQAPPPFHFTIRAWPDGAIIGGGLLGAALPSILGSHFPLASCGGACDPSHLWGLDRIAVGAVHWGQDRASGYTMLATAAASTLLVAATRRGEPRASSAMLEDVAVMADVAAVDGFATQWLKVLVRRPRPERYTAQGAQFAGIVEDSRAFPSGHTSFAFAAAVAAASILQRRGELRQHRVETLLLFSGAVATSILRVTSHRHFPTDVVGGAVLGSAIGWIVPQLHGHY
jgi:hypothetical protein